MRPTFVPTERLTKNIGAYLLDHPEDAKAYYNLGRVHFLAYVNKSRMVPSTGGKDYPAVAADHLIGGEWLHFERDQLARKRALEEMEVDSVQDLDDPGTQAFYDRVVEIYQQLEQENWRPDPLTEADLVHHALAAVTAFQQAVALEPTNGLYQLGLASLLETMSQQQQEETLARLQRQMATRRYQLAFDAALESDRQLERIPITGLQSIVSLEAARAIRRLTADRNTPLPESIRSHLETMENLPRGPITPVVFAWQPRCYETLESSQVVLFDLDADGQAKPWHWVRPDVGILVWMPLEQSVVESGAQLFGPFAFHQLWASGYAALEALDDNRDGQLAGGELVGMQAWFDRNQDGQADRGELQDVRTLGIAAIRVQATSQTNSILHHPEGILLRDGRTIPTWDWQARPAD